MNLHTSVSYCYLQKSVFLGLKPDLLKYLQSDTSLDNIILHN
jgi:hypothetical protein